MLSRIDDTIDTLIGARFLFKRDLRSGYWQVEMEEEDKEKTVFFCWFVRFLRMQQYGFRFYKCTSNVSTFTRTLHGGVKPERMSNFLRQYTYFFRILSRNI